MALARLVFRLPVPPEVRPAAQVWAHRSHGRIARLLSAWRTLIAAVVFGLAYLFTAQLALAALALAMVVAYLFAVAVWAGAHAWERSEVARLHPPRAVLPRSADAARESPSREGQQGHERAAAARDRADQRWLLGTACAVLSVLVWSVLGRPAGPGSRRQ